MISYFRDGRLYEAESFLSIVKPDYTECPMIAAVGAGGKTSTLRRLAEEYALLGKKAIVLTTTHMKEETTPWSCVAEEEEWICKGKALLERVKECLDGGKSEKRENGLRSGADSGRDRKMECAIAC